MTVLPLQLYDTLSGTVGPVRPLVPSNLSLYVCGMTVYDDCHIGHARTMLVFDVLVRYLRAQGVTVRYVRNITDVDDRIIERAGERGGMARELVAEMTGSMHRDFAALGMLEPDLEPRASDEIAGMLEMIGSLMERGLAYRSESGDVWFRVGAFDRYGRLSGRTAVPADAGHSRQSGEASGQKDDIRDFALWKAADAQDRAVGTVWASPWGEGRPGWHIECSAMSTRHLGQEFDLHGGGLDLLFPHHENELAQAAGVGCGFAQRWMHVAPLCMGSVKMSKSLGNCLGICEALSLWPAEAVRHALLNAHYRSPLEFGDARMSESRAVLDRWYGVLEEVAPVAAADGEGERAESSVRADFEAALADDLNVPEALAALSAGVKRVKDAAGHRATASVLAAELVMMAGHLGLLQCSPGAWFKKKGAVVGQISEDEVDEQIKERERQRRAGNYAEADCIRDRLAAQGVELLDSADGTRWRRSAG